MFERDQKQVFDEEHRMLARIWSTRQQEVQLKRLPKPYWPYQELFKNDKVAMLAPRRTFDHARKSKTRGYSSIVTDIPKVSIPVGIMKQISSPMLAGGKIVHSKSPTGSPILLVPTPDGRVRICVDYHQLNTLTILNKYPLPLMTELRQRVAGGTIFTKLGPRDGYHQIQITKGDERKRLFAYYMDTTNTK